MARTNTNPNQPNRRASILNSRPLGGNRDSILSGGFLNNLTGGAQNRSQQLGGAVPLTVAQPQSPQRPQPQAQQVPPMQGPQVPQMQGPEAPQRAAQQQVPVQAVAQPTATPTAPQAPTTAIPTQPGGAVAGGVPIQAVTGQPMSREQELEQTINQLLTQQEEQIGTLQSQGASRGIVRPFAQGVEGAVRRQTASEVAPFQRELTARRDEEERQFQRNIQQQRLNIDRARLALAQQAAAQSGSVNAAAEKLQGSNNQTKLQFVLENAELPAGIRTNVGDVLSVVSGVTDLAQANPEGKFAGLGPIFRKPGILQSRGGIQNRQKIEAINLLAQKWASGAALTEAQTKQVAKFTPDKNDTDRQVRNKVDGLVDLMLSDVQGKLQASGVFGFEMEPADFFGAGAQGVETFTLPTGQQVSAGDTVTLPNGQTATIGAGGVVTIQ